MLFQLKRKHDSSNPTTEQQSTFLARSNWEDLIRYLVYAYITKNYYKPIDLLFIDAAACLCILTFPSSFPFLYLIPVSGSVMIVSSAGYLHHPSLPEFVRRSLLLWWLRFLDLSACIVLAPLLLLFPPFF